MWPATTSSRHKKTGTILEYALLFPWLLPTILICYSYRTFFNSSDVWYVFGQNLYYADRVRILIVIAYTVVKLPFSLRMIKASFYAIDEELEDAARNLGSGPVRTFLKVKLPIILPSVLAVFALNFNALFTEYDMSATFASTYGTTYAMVIQSHVPRGGACTAIMSTPPAAGAPPRCSSCSCRASFCISYTAWARAILASGWRPGSAGRRVKSKADRAVQKGAAVAAKKAAVAAAVPDEPEKSCNEDQYHCF